MPVHDPDRAAAPGRRRVRAARRCAPALACGAVLLLTASLAGCEPANPTEKEGSGEMFGLFKSKKTTSVVAPEVGAPLKRETMFPANASGKLAEPPYGYAVESQIEGTPPAARFVDQRVEGQTTTAYRVPAIGAQPPVTILNVVDKGLPACEIWEMDPKRPERFAKRRLAQFDPAQSKWTGYAVNGATLLPGGQVLVGLYYVDPSAKVGFYVYDIASNSVRPLGVVQPDWSQGVPFVYADTIQLSPDAAAVLYHTDKLLLGSERYANQHDRVLLFSRRHPHGLQVLDLGIDDGNVRRWGAVGRTLWFQTVDDRKPKAPVSFVWSLDLSNAL
jgi:hypothetical protein